LRCPSSRIPRPPRSALFPYTTLFRSHQQNKIGRFFSEGNHGRENQSEGNKRNIYRHQVYQFFSEVGRGEVTDVCSFHHLDAGVLDRKSTRLNSSHVKISYAVFCLKKK